MQKYYKDYVAEEKINEDGKVTTEVAYRGDYYQYHLSQLEYGKLRKIILFQTLLIGTLFFLAGTLNNKGSFSFYVVLPYLCILPGVFYLFSGFFHMSKKLQKLEYMQYDKSYIKVKFAFVGVLAASMTTVIGDTVFLIKNIDEIEMGKELAFISLNLIIVFISIITLIYHNRIVCEKVNI